MPAQQAGGGDESTLRSASAAAQKGNTVIRRADPASVWTLLEFLSSRRAREKKETKGWRVDDAQRVRTPCPSLHHPSFAHGGSFVRPHRVDTSGL